MARSPTPQEFQIDLSKEDKLSLLGCDVWCVILDFFGFEQCILKLFILRRVSRFFHLTVKDCRELSYAKRHKSSSQIVFIQFWNFEFEWQKSLNSLLLTDQNKTSNEFINWCMREGFKFSGKNAIEYFVKNSRNLESFKRFLTKNFTWDPAVTFCQSGSEITTLCVSAVKFNKLCIFEWLLNHFKSKIYFRSKDILSSILETKNFRAFEIFYDNYDYVSVDYLDQFAEHSCFNKTTMKFIKDKIKGNGKITGFADRKMFVQCCYQRAFIGRNRGLVRMLNKLNLEKLVGVFFIGWKRSD